MVVCLAHVYQHISQAEHNESFLSVIGKDSDYIDWKFIALFYSALHFGDAFIAKKQRNDEIFFKDHSERRKVYSKNFDIDTFNAYKKLENYSKTARYHPEGNHILTENLFQRLFKEDFSKMKSLR